MLCWDGTYNVSGCDNRDKADSRPGISVVSMTCPEKAAHTLSCFSPACHCIFGNMQLYKPCALSCNWTALVVGVM